MPSPGNVEALRDLHVATSSPFVTANVVLAMGVGMIAAFLIVRFARSWSFRVPGVREAALSALRATRELPLEDRLAAQAVILRRIARTIAGESSARLQGRPWLLELDRLFRTQYFTEGEGHRIGDDLYVPQASKGLDIGLDTGIHLERLMRRIRR
jgi:Domain of unknown function (DUF4381)